jgi:hypothetical protein
MSIFDLLFILLFFASIATLLTAAVLAVRGRGTRALRILRVYAIGFGLYMGIVLAVALATPRRILNLPEDRCFDDWCAAVQNVDRTPSATGVSYIVTLRLSSRARRVSQRARGSYVYLSDDRGRRFDPSPDAAEPPFDVLLDPGQAVETKRSFTVPNDAREIGAVVVHEGSYCFPGCFIIGDEANPLHKRTIVRLP